MYLLKWIRKLLAVLLLLFVLLAGLAYFIAGTESGLQFAARVLQSQLGEYVQIGQLGGRLVSVIEVTDLRIQVGEDVYSLRQARLDWSPLALFSGELRVNHLSAASVTVTIAPSPDSESGSFSVDIDLPINITLGEGVIESLSIAGLSEEALHFERIALSARTENRQLQIRSFELHADGYQAGLAGHFGLQPHLPSDLQLDWRIDTGTAAAVLAAGQARLTGLLHDYRLQGETSLSGTDIPAGHWRFTAEGSLDGLAVSHLAGETLDGSITGSGKIDWQQGLGWQLALDLQQINPGKHWPEWPGTLTTQLASNGRLLDSDRQLVLQLQKLQGELRGYPVAGQIDVKLDNERLDIQQLDLTSGENSITASGGIEKSWDIIAQATLPDMEGLLPGWQGSLSLSGRIHGKRDQPQLAATVTAQQLTGPALAIGALAGEVQLQWSESAGQSASLGMQAVELAGQLYEDATLEFNGSVHSHRLTVVASGKETAIDLQLAGDWLDQVWRGEILAADWQFPGTGPWSLQLPVRAELGAQHVLLPETCWQQDSARLCMKAQGNPEKQLSPQVQLSHFPLATLGALSGSPLTFTSLVDATLSATIEAGNVTFADLLVNLGAGTISYEDPVVPTDSHIRQGMLRALLNDKGITGNAVLDISDADYLRANLHLPGYQPGITPWDQQALDMSLGGELHDLLLVEYLLDEVGSYEGTIVLDFEGKGTLGQPRLSGSASITDSTFEIDDLGLRLTNLELRLQSKADGLVITGSCDSGKGSVQLDGDVNIVDFAHWEAMVNLKGSDFEIMHLPEAIINVSPDLHASITPPKLKLSGEVHVPYARLRPRDMRSRTGVSSDVIIIEAEQDTSSEPAERWQVSSKIRLSLGDDVDIKGLGLQGDLLGTVDLLDRPGQATTAQGKLSIERGSYEVYGRRLDISRGRLLFSGGPVDNPGLDFDASRRVDNVTAGIRAKGTLKVPEITLYSDPTMPESDIISYIAFGKPQSEIGQGEGSMTDAGLIAGGNMLTGILGTSMGLEEFGVESGATLQEAAMVLGTYLSPKLYVRYRAGLYDAINEFEVRYEFTRRWSVRTITSVEHTTAQVQFSFEH
jgi:translocation and assembly module TamB